MAFVLSLFNHILELGCKFCPGSIFMVRLQLLEQKFPLQNGPWWTFYRRTEAWTSPVQLPKVSGSVSFGVICRHAENLNHFHPQKQWAGWVLNVNNPVVSCCCQLLLCFKKSQRKAIVSTQFISHVMLCHAQSLFIFRLMMAQTADPW